MTPFLWMNYEDSFFVEKYVIPFGGYSSGFSIETMNTVLNNVGILLGGGCT